MTDEDRKKPEAPGAGWDYVEDLLAEEEIERQRAMPAEERRAEMKARGLDPDRAHTLANEALAKLGYPTAPAEAPNVVNLKAEREKRRAKPARPLWMTALVAAAAVALVVGGGAGVVVALRTPGPAPTTVPPIPTAPPGPSPEELAQEQRAKAEELRKVAVADCNASKWKGCKERLDQAATLDPQGDAARLVQRLHKKASLGVIRDDLDAKAGTAPRSLDDHAKDKLVAALAASRGQAARLACARGAEPTHLCDQLAASMSRAGWIVTRVTLPPVPPDASGPRGLRVEVATDADEPTQAAADTLVGALEKVLLLAVGPDDVAPGGDAPLRLTVGAQ